jgi:hypothetical protein
MSWHQLYNSLPTVLQTLIKSYCDDKSKTRISICNRIQDGLYKPMCNDIISQIQDILYQHEIESNHRFFEVEYYGHIPDRLLGKGDSFIVASFSMRIKCGNKTRKATISITNNNELVIKNAKCVENIFAMEGMLNHVCEMPSLPVIDKKLSRCNCPTRKLKLPCRGNKHSCNYPCNIELCDSCDPSFYDMVGREWNE